MDLYKNTMGWSIYDGFFPNPFEINDKPPRSLDLAVGVSQVAGGIAENTLEWVAETCSNEFLMTMALEEN